MKITILDSVPIYDKYEETIFGSGHNLLWVLFAINDDEKWIGKFESGAVKSNSKVLLCQDAIHCYILVNGNVFYVNALTKKGDFIIKDKDIEDMICIPDMNYLVITNGLSIMYFDVVKQDIIWKSKRISWDGVLFDSYTNGIIKGKLNDLGTEYCSCPFEFNVFEDMLTVKYAVPPPE